MSRSLIVHVGNYDPDALEGVAITLVGQCNALLESGLPVEVWTFRGDVTEVSSRKYPNGLEVHVLPRHRNQFLAAMALPPVTKEWIARRLPEVRFFHLHSVFSPHNNRVASLGIPYAVTPNGGWGPAVILGRRSLMKRIWIRLFEESLWKNASFVQAVSPNEVSDLEALGIGSHVVLVPNGTDIVSRVERPADLPRRWLFLGRLAVNQKGLDLLLQGYARAKGQGAPLPHLILAGPDFRGGMNTLKALAKELLIDDVVEFPGPVTGAVKEALWNSCELFLHTSRWEGLPLSILEALGHGIPCLVTPETGLGDWMEMNYSGWHVKGDIESIAAKLAALAIDPQEIEAKARKTQVAAMRDYSWEAIGKKLSDFYVSVPI